MVFEGCSTNILEKSWDWSMVLLAIIDQSKNIRFLEIYADPQLQNSEELIAKMSDFIRGLPDDPRFWESNKRVA